MNEISGTIGSPERPNALPQDPVKESIVEENIKDFVAKGVEGEELESLLREEISRTLQWSDPNLALAPEKEMAKAWGDHERSSLATDLYEKSLAEGMEQNGLCRGGSALRASCINSSIKRHHVFAFS